MRFDANVSILFPDVPPLERPAAAAALGFDAIELWWPFETEVPAAAEVDRLVDAIGSAGTSLVALNLTSGDAAKGEHGLVALPGQRQRFLDSLDVAIELAGRTGCRMFNALYGNPPEAERPELVTETAIENLATAVRRGRDTGVTIAVEALNAIDFPRYGLHLVETAVTLIERTLEATSEPVGLLFDIYHVQRAEGDVIRRIEAFASRVAHVQIADAPGRFCPGTGEIAFERVLPALEAAGYDGYVGLESRPSANPDETFTWLPRERRSTRGAPQRWATEA